MKQEMNLIITMLLIIVLLVIVTGFGGFIIAALLKWGYGVEHDLSCRIGADFWKVSLLGTGLYFLIAQFKNDKL